MHGSGPGPRASPILLSREPQAQSVSIGTWKMLLPRTVRRYRRARLHVKSSDRDDSSPGGANAGVRPHLNDENRPPIGLEPPTARFEVQVLGEELHYHEISVLPRVRRISVLCPISVPATIRARTSVLPTLPPKSDNIHAAVQLFESEYRNIRRHRSAGFGEGGRGISGPRQRVVIE